jgi:uncharacterized protein YndB with AHSA1/START domain
LQLPNNLMNNPITISTTINASIEKIWNSWNEPQHITGWAFASDDWCSPRATNHLRVGGTFTTRMESRDGKEGFDFSGTYTNVIENKKIEYTAADGRKVSVEFTEHDGGCIVTETFEPENENPREMQQQGWQSILNNFKSYVERA